MSSATITFSLFGKMICLNPSNSFTIFGHQFYWYGVIIAVGFLLAVLYVSRHSKEFGYSSDDFIDMLIYAVPLAIVCARLYYVVFNFSEYRSNPSDIFRIWKGGLAIYGGIIGGVTGAFIYCRVKKVPMLPMLDIGAFGLLIGQAVGRWGNFINREAYGNETALPWKMGLITKTGIEYYHPTFLYESCWNLLGFLLLHFYFRKRRKYDGEIFLIYAAWYGLGRTIIERLRTDSLYLFSTNIRVSQLIAALSLLTALIILFWNRFIKRPDPEKMYVNNSAGKQSPGEDEESGSNPVG